MAAVEERGFERFLTFLDAIVAIAITLLVLPLVELTADLHGGDSVTDLLRHDQSKIWAFLLSFVVVSRFWFAQHDTARHLVRYHPRVAGLLMLWALTIVFLPFPTALVAGASNNATTKVLYIGTMTVTVLLLSGVEWFLRRHPELTDDDPEGDLDPLDGLVTALLLVVALVLSVAVPTLSYFPLLLLLAAGALARAGRRLRGRGDRRTPVGE
jgi:uncharacterized membrane protein